MPKRRPDSKKPIVKTAPAKRPFDEKTMCGAQLRNKERGRLCQQPKGYKTHHPGDGKCWLHGGLTPIKHGLNSLIQHGRLRDLIQKIKELDQTTMDLEPEVILMRAMVIDFVNRYDDFVDALMTWYNAIDEKNKAADLPPIPRRYPELEDAAKLIEGTSRIVERMHKVQREGSITLDVFRSVMTQMGMIVAKHVEDSDQLAKIEEEWSTILVDPKSFLRESPVPAPVQDDEE